MSGGGVILVRNNGGYIARFSVKYRGPDDRCYSENSGNFPLGIKKAIEFPPGSTDIAVKVEEMWGFGWSTIFTKEYPNVVRKEFHVYGTTLHPTYREIDEGQSK